MGVGGLCMELQRVRGLRERKLVSKLMGTGCEGVGRKRNRRDANSQRHQTEDPEHCVSVKMPQGWGRHRDGKCR